MNEPLRPYSDQAKAKKIKEQAEKIREKSAIIKGNFRFRVRFRLVWIGCYYTVSYFGSLLYRFIQLMRVAPQV